MNGRSVAGTLVAAPPSRAAARLSSRRRLRVLGYHSVADRSRFRSQMTLVARTMRVLSLGEVIAARRASRWPVDAVWLTFDDGDPSVVEVGLPVLRELGLAATLFVCPGTVDTQEPFWWERVAEDQLARLKRIPDQVRRAEVAETPSRRRPQITTTQLGEWVSAGQSIGNHTWDHPLLDTCPPAVQEKQIVRAHDWLRERFGKAATRAFAYPNGNATPAARAALERLGYDLAVLFDHRLTRHDQDPLALSRLRIDAHAEHRRAAAILSGSHSAAYQLGRFLRG